MKNPYVMEYTQVKALQVKELVVGQPYFLLCSRWWSLWKQHCQFPTELSRPGVIDNGPLLTACGTVKPTLSPEDYKLLTEAAWDKLFSL